MAGSVNIFNTGKSGLFASRSAMSTTGHNIANVNTEGYSRQRVEQETATPQAWGTAVYGTGVRLNAIQRINDEYLTKQVAHETKHLGAYKEKDMALNQADTIFNELNNEGLNRLMSRFFNEFRKLGNEPESEAIRASVRENTNQLAGDFHRISRSLTDIQKNLDVRIDAGIREANELVSRISHLNQEIKRLELTRSETGDLRDKRDLAVKKLSEIVDVQVGSNERGEFTVSLNGIGPLVSGSLKNNLYIETAPADPATGRPEQGLVVRLEHNNAPDLNYKIKTGKLGGLLESRDQILGSAKNRIDELAYAFATKVNEIHRQGFNINGTTGIDFFETPDQVKDAALLLKLSKEVEADANNIATALQPDSPGDNRVTQLIGKLQHQRLMSGGKSTFDEHYNATVADIATITQKNRQVMDHQTHVVEQLEKVRQSISGVSLDEETTNLIQYQQAFNASAKVIQMADQMLDTILNLKR